MTELLRQPMSTTTTRNEPCCALKRRKLQLLTTQTRLRTTSRVLGVKYVQTEFPCYAIVVSVQGSHGSMVGESLCYLSQIILCRRTQQDQVCV